MNPSHAIRRPARVLAGLAMALLAVIAAAPAALATPPPLPPGWNKHPPLPAATRPALRLPPGWNKHPPLPDPARAHAVLASSMPGWQITLIALAAMLFAATVAVATYRVRAARRRITATSSI
jgi:hypothetical protein